MSNQQISERKINEINEIEEGIDAIVLGGDNAEISWNLNEHKVLINKLRKRFGATPIAFVLGNHELWGQWLHWPVKRLLEETFPAFAQRESLVYLERQNLGLNGVTIVGTYGHYDYSLGRTDKGVTLDHITRGEKRFGRYVIQWGDKQQIDTQGRTDTDICEKLVKAFSDRMQTAIGEVISISHTVPSKELIGHPDSPEQDFLGAYSGSTRIGEVIKKYRGFLHLCGHTHAKAEGKIGKTRVINVGADYDLLRYAIIDTKTKQVEMREKKIE